ncbi:MAG: hypothetical protein BIFFINMI_01977 [Phycisphaerae bacterium]|nr:hypothetical protein [Phycisphaerae bacterium]
MNDLSYPEIVEGVAKAVDDLVRNEAVKGRFCAFLAKWAEQDRAARDRVRAHRDAQEQYKAKLASLPLSHPLRHVHKTPPGMVWLRRDFDQGRPNVGYWPIELTKHLVAPPFPLPVVRTRQ